jgi:hypothetical protein
MNNTAGLLAALGFVALGLTSTSADAHVDVAIAPVAVAVAAPGLVVTLGTPPPVVYAPPAPVLYAPPPPTTVVYSRPSYRAPVRYYPSRPVVVYDRAPSCNAPSHRGHGHAYGHSKHKGPPAHARGHGAKHRR